MCFQRFVILSIISRSTGRHIRLPGGENLPIEQSTINYRDQELKIRQENFQQLVERLSEVIFTVDTNTIITYISPVVSRLLGYDAKEVIGRSFFDFIYPEDRELLQKEYLKNINGVIEPSEFRIYDKTGSVRYVRSSSAPPYNDGEVTTLTGILTDITEQRKTEIALRENEEKFRDLVESISDTIFEIDGTCHLVYVSPGITNVLEYSPEELKGIYFLDLVHPDDRDRLNSRFSELTKGIEYPTDYRVITKSGKSRWVRTRTKPIIREGSFTGARGTLIDITERKSADKALQESEEKYRLIAENTADTIWILDLNLHFTYNSPSIKKLRGYSPDEAAEQTLDQVLTPESLDFAITIFQEEMALERSGTADPYRSRSFELEEYKKDGSTIWVENMVSFLRDENRTCTGILGISRDITDRKRAEEELRESEEKYRTLVEHVHDGIYIYQGMSFVFANDRVCEISGYSKDELYSMEFSELVHPDDVEHVMEITRRRAGGEPVPPTYNARIIRKDSGVRYLEVAASEILLKGNYAVLGAVRDITEEKTAEDLLRKSEERYRGLIQGVPDYILVHRNGKIIFVNPASALALGFTPGEILGSDITDHLAPESRDLTTDMALQRLKGADVPPYEIILIAKNGERKITEVRGSVIDYDGEPAILNVLTDITVRKEAEDRLRESEEKFRIAFEDAAIGMIIGGVDGSFLEVNTAFSEMLGRHPQEILSCSYSEVTHANDIEKTRIMRESLLSGERRTVHFDKRYLHANGSTVWGHVSTFLIHHQDGTPAYFISHIQDITERRRIEEEVRKAVKQITSNMEQMAILNDTIRNPLAVIVALTDMERGESHDKIMESAREIDGIITRLDSGWIESEKVRHFLRTHHHFYDEEERR
jgi:PAS domain S-box-containing protein